MRLRLLALLGALVLSACGADQTFAAELRFEGEETHIEIGEQAWRVRDARNYYVCRVNPLESNYRVYVVKDGVRRQLATALCSVETGTWHRLEVEHVGDRITCWLDGRKLLEANDATLTEAGGLGLWTKADARTSFDDFVGG